MTRFHDRQIGVFLSVAAGLLSLLLSGCATTAPDRFPEGTPVFTRAYDDSTPLATVESLLFAYRAGDYSAVYFLTKPADGHSAAARDAFLKEVESGDEWTPALWQIEPHVAYTKDRESADVVASVLSDLEGFLYTDTMRFYCFLDGEHWKVARHAFEGESMVLAPVEAEGPRPAAPQIP